MLSIFLINLVLLALDWLFDNFKNSKFNKSARLFRQKIRRLLLILKIFVKTFYLAQ